MDLLSKNRAFELSKYLDTEGLKKILFPVLETFYPKDALDILKSNNDLLYGTPYLLLWKLKKHI